MKEKFSLHSAGVNDSHWQSKYLGRNGVLAREEKLLEELEQGFGFASKTMIAGLQDSNPLVQKTAEEFLAGYVEKLCTVASTFYSARLLRPWYVAFRLRDLVFQLDTLFRPVEKTPVQKECLMAFHMYLSKSEKFLFLFGQAQAHLKRVAEIGKEVLASKDATLATRLLTKARLANLPILTGTERTHYRNQVHEALNQFAADPDRICEVAQEWKTLCRLAMLTKAWHHVELALMNDSSRDLRIKAWTQPGFWFHKFINFFPS